MDGLFSIGDFSRMSRLTVRALRLYDEQGILKPGHVDPSTGYRYYSSAQLAEADLVRRLRTMQMPLDEIGVFLREEDPDERLRLLKDHRGRLEARALEYRSIAASIDRLIEGREEIMERNVEMKELANLPVPGFRFRTSMADIGARIGEAYRALFGYLGKVSEFPAGPPFCLYHDEEYREEDADVEACVPTARLLPGEGGVRGRELPGGKAASTLHTGPYELVGETYGVVMKWIAENGYRPSGPCREVYLVGPEQVNDPSEYRTEILCPVEPLG